MKRLIKWILKKDLDQLAYSIKELNDCANDFIKFKGYAREKISELTTQNQNLRILFQNLTKSPEIPKYKTGTICGNFAVSKEAAGTECNPYQCIDKEGELYFFTEQQIDAMIKLNERN